MKEPKDSRDQMYVCLSTRYTYLFIHVYILYK